MNTDYLMDLMLAISKVQREEALGKEYEDYLDSLPQVKDPEPEDLEDGRN